MEDWLEQVYAELRCTIPDRLNEDELRRFYNVSNGDFAKFLKSVKKTIQWRRKFTLLSRQELDAWGNFVFWHGLDIMQRPSLVIRIGLAGSTLDSHDQEEFVRAVVSQVEHGVKKLADPENPQFTVVLDCDRLSPFDQFPLQSFRSCVALLQDHYPNRLGCVLVVRVPDNAKVMTQTLYQELRPGTQPKVTIVEPLEYRDFLKRYFKELPDFPQSRDEAIGGLIALFVLFVLIVFILIIIFVSNS